MRIIADNKNRDSWPLYQSIFYYFLSASKWFSLSILQTLETYSIYNIQGKLWAKFIEKSSLLIVSRSSSFKYQTSLKWLLQGLNCSLQGCIFYYFQLPFQHSFYHSLWINWNQYPSNSQYHQTSEILSQSDGISSAACTSWCSCRAFVSLWCPLIISPSQAFRYPASILSQHIFSNLIAKPVKGSFIQAFSSRFFFFSSSNRYFSFFSLSLITIYSSFF